MDAKEREWGEELLGIGDWLLGQIKKPPLLLSLES
jgi:hypothetical protein